MSRARSRRTRVSIPVKLGVFAVLVLIAGFMPLVYLSYQDLASIIEREQNEHVNMIVSSTNLVLNKTTTLSTANAQHLCDRFVEQDLDIVSSAYYIVRPDNTALCVAGSDRRLLGKAIDVSEVARIKTAGILLKSAQDNKSEADQELTFLVLANGKPIILRMGLNFRWHGIVTFNYLARAGIFLALAAIAIGFILYLAIKIELCAPLRRIAASIREIIRGNFTEHLPDNRRDEIGGLSIQIGLLAMALQSRQQENERLSSALREKWVAAEKKSSIDFLTGLENNRSFHAKLEAELSSASTNGTPLSLLFCDLDKFKAFNDTNGHPLGDKALADTASVIRDSIRSADFAARYGGEEFAIILPATDAKTALMLAERLRKNIEQHLFTTAKGRGHMTISIGVASYPADAADKDTLIAAADQAMYSSKSNGKNQVTLFNGFLPPQRSRIS